MSAVENASVAVMTDERLAHATPWALLLIAVLLVTALCWIDRGKPWSTDEDAEPDAFPPPVSPEAVSIERLRRDADRG